jgi:isopenicillin N synthase-like dioxygenase
VVTDYISARHALSGELMSLCAVALGLPANFFLPISSSHSWITPPMGAI